MSPIPEHIAIVGGGRLLRLVMTDGTATEIAATSLRAGCNCAGCRRARLEGPGPTPDAAVTIVEAAAVGQYAVSVGFSDGHGRGIYPWSYLAEIAARA